MDPINSLSQISQLLRKKLSEKQVESGLKTERKSAPAPRGAGASKASAEEIRKLIKNRIAALDPAEREGRQAALIFVESILAWEFGETALDDPQFSALSKEVQLSITESVEHWPRFQQMLRSL